MDIIESLFERIRAGDRPGANALLDAWSEAQGHDRLLAEVLEPLLRRIGEEWCGEGTCTLAQAYVAGKVAEDALAKIAAGLGAEPAVTQGPVVVGNIADDFHALGRRMVGKFLRAAGWEVHDLGNDVAPEAFVETACRVGARIVGASAMTLGTARNVRRLRDEIDRRGLAGRLQLAVGGAVFLVRPELLSEVGGDGTARSAPEAGRLFAELWERSVRAGPAP